MYVDITFLPFNCQFVDVFGTIDALFGTIDALFGTIDALFGISIMLT